MAVKGCAVPNATLAVGGLTAMLIRAKAVTVKVVDPVIVPEVAMMLEVPGVRVLAKPAAFTVTTVWVSEDHVTMLVRSCMLPSLNVPIAVNCCELLDESERFVGVTVIATSTAALTVNRVEAALAPKLALIVAVPVLILLASPWVPIALLTVATAVVSELHCTELLMFCVVPSV